MLDSIRYFLAVVILACITPAIFVWFLVHPLIRHWRRAGSKWTYATVFLVSNLSALVLFLLRRRFVVGDRGGSLPLALAGVACLVVSSILKRSVARQLTRRTLLGLPELAPDRVPQPLLTEGIYTRIRHPRYVQFSIGTLGLTLLVDYKGIYLLCLVWIAAIYLIVLLEEKELRARYGPAYDEYARRVPRFLPRRRSRA